MVAPKGRKHLSADALFRLVRHGFARILDDRAEEPGISLTDALMSAFAMFSLKSPSLLAFDKERVEGNLQTIYGIEHAPCDTYMRELIDPVFPESLRPVFQDVFRQLQRGKALEPMLFLNGGLFARPRWHGVFLLQDDSLYVVSTQGPPQRFHYLLSPNVGRGDYPSRLSGSDSAHARTNCETRWHSQK